MSIVIDKAIIALSEYFGRMDEHDKQRNVLRNHLNTIVKETSELEDEVDYRREAMNTIIPQQDEEIGQLTEERDEWKATAIRAVNSILRSGTVCEFCQHNPNDCIGTPCPDVLLKDALTHFGAPEEDA